jgi:hypothetical protein
LALAGHGSRREADREHRDQNDCDRMNEAERDRAGQAEHIAAAELRELLGQETAVHQRRELRPESRVDDGQQKAPHCERDAHEREADTLELDGLPEQRPVHCGPPS